MNQEINYRNRNNYQSECDTILRKFSIQCISRGWRLCVWLRSRLLNIRSEKNQIIKFLNETEFIELIILLLSNEVHNIKNNSTLNIYQWKKKFLPSCRMVYLHINLLATYYWYLNIERGWRVRETIRLKKFFHFFFSRLLY